MEQNQIKVGTIAELKVECLGNPPGTPGICYEMYDLGRPGYSFIFENGKYDGFSPDDVKVALDIKFCFNCDYRFTNVGLLVKDFKVTLLPLIKAWKLNKNSLGSLKTFNCSLNRFARHK